MREPLRSILSTRRPSGATMRLRVLLPFAVFVISCMLPSGSTFAREPIFLSADSARHDRPILKSAAYPWIDYRVTTNGYVWTTIHNNGVIGNIFGVQMPDIRKSAPSFQYPRMSRVQYAHYAALWVGGVVGSDTLVSTGIETDWKWTYWPQPLEFWPFEWPSSLIETISDDPSSEYYSPEAKAEMQYTTTYTDTNTSFGSYTPYNNYDGRSHKPLGLAVKQTTYSWSYKYIRDVMIIDYQITNIGGDTIHDAFVGIYQVGCVQHTGEQFAPPDDDIAGFIRSWPYDFDELDHELLNLAWVLDADGWSHSNGWDIMNSVNAFFVAPLRVPSGASLYNFNWWYDNVGTRYDWGPRKGSTADWPLRPFEEGLGVPRSDRDKYYIMAKPEIDYNGYEAAVNHTNRGWLPPHEYAENIADGYMPEVVVSYGPATIPPGGAVNFTVVMGVGKDVHYDRGAFRALFDPLQPERFVQQLDFEDVITNVRWARLIFDNPGVDTDHDGDSGKYFDHYDQEVDDTVRVYFEGDGVPDIRGAAPPPPPDLRVLPDDGEITLRWNGRLSETHFDQFSYVHDFEGYRVYMSRSEFADEPTLLASYDRHNFSRYTWDKRRDRYRLKDLPFSLDSLKFLYGADFDPLKFRVESPLVADGNTYYFEKVDYNASELDNPIGIRRVYPDALKDTSDVDEEGRMRYYEYEYVIDNLLPTMPYFVTVTAFDFGHPPKSLEALESSPYKNMVEVMAVKQGEAVLNNGQLDVYCYPNPYRLDADYAERGFENRAGLFAPSRSSTIYFANLPHKCTISIFTLDGDRVRTLHHDEPAGSGTSSTHRWNLITSNTMWVVSGLYYWVVESEYGSQIGKLVIIK